MTINYLTPCQAARMLNVSTKTLKRWESSGLIEAKRMPNGYRRYAESEINRIAGIKSELNNNKNPPVVVYVRVSSHEQKAKGDLDRQKGRVLEYCVQKGYEVLQIFSEVGSGMNSSRPKLQQLFRLVTSKKISRVIVEHQDRLTRFNFEFLQYFFEIFDVKIEWISDTLQGSYEAELVKDIISLMSSMSGKVYGKRSAERRSKDKAKLRSEDEISNADSSPNSPETV